MEQQVDFKKVLEKSEERIQNIKKERDTPTTNTTRNLVFGGVLVGTTLFAGMIFLQIITGIIVLGAVGIFSLGAFFVLKNFKKYDKLVAQKVKNHALSLQLKEAQANNIAQLKNTVLARKERLKEGINNHNKMGGYVEKLKQKIERACSEDPFIDQKKQTYERIHAAYLMNKDRLKKAKDSIDTFEKKVYHYEEMSEFTAMANKAMDTIANNELENMLSLAAFDSIDSEFCEAMVGLENAMEFE